MTDEVLQLLLVFVSIEVVSVLVVSLEFKSNEFHTGFLNRETRILGHILA